MQRKRIRITFEEYLAEYADDPTGLLHRVRNFGETIYRAIRGQRIVTLLNMDTAVDTLELIVPSAGKVPRVKRILEKCLAEENFDKATIVVADDAG